MKARNFFMWFSTFGQVKNWPSRKHLKSPFSHSCRLNEEDKHPFQDRPGFYGVSTDLMKEGDGPKLAK
jgi:hypothetical protein